MLKSNNKLNAFTLAEVLITLGIIGIVAALTIPTLMNNTQDRETITKVKKEYSILNQALKLANVDNGDITSWGNTAISGGDVRNVFIIADYLKKAKDCKFSADGCMASGYKMINTGNERDFENLDSYYKLILADGTTVAMEGWSTGSTEYLGEIWIDVNGSQKPNVAGKDLFLFIFTSKNSIVPYAQVVPSNQGPSGLQSNGYAGSLWILDFDNMDYAKCPTQVSFTGAHSCS